MPARTAAVATKSRRVARSPTAHGPNIATQTGAEYWIRIALAGVVSLLARMNKPVVAASAAAAIHSAGEMPRSAGRPIPYSRAAAIAQRADQIAPGCHATSLISAPAVLQRTPHS